MANLTESEFFVPLEQLPRVSDEEPLGVALQMMNQARFTGLVTQYPDNRVAFVNGQRLMEELSLRHESSLPMETSLGKLLSNLDTSEIVLPMITLRNTESHIKVNDLFSKSVVVQVNDAARPLGYLIDQVFRTAMTKRHTFVCRAGHRTHMLCNNRCCVDGEEIANVE